MKRAPTGPRQPAWARRLAPDPPTHAAGPELVTIHQPPNYAFAVPDRLRPGLTTIPPRHQGKELLTHPSSAWARKTLTDFQARSQPP